MLKLETQPTKFANKTEKHLLSSNLAANTLSIKQKMYRELISNWQYTSEQQSMSPQQCFINFRQQLVNKQKIQIILDNFLGEVLITLSKDQKFYQYASTKKHFNKHRQILIIINEEIYKQNFISKRQYLKFKKELPPLILFSLDKFIQELKKQKLYDNKGQKQHKQHKDETQQNNKLVIFNSQMKMTFQKFWKIVIILNITEPIIKDLYFEFKNSLKSLKLKSRIDLFMSEWMETEKQESKFLADQMSIMSISNISMSQLSLKMTHSQLQKELHAYANKISLYLNPHMCEGFQNQLKQAIYFMQRHSNQSQIQYRVFGSFCTKFALVNASDIDIVLLFDLQDQDNRYKKTQLLKSIKQILQYGDASEGLNHYYNSKVFSFPGLPHPFLKIQYIRNVPNIAPSIDFIINNNHGIINSQLFAQYAQNQYILKFGNLIKKWALKTTLINTAKKIAGISSYGLIQMMLYYLMKTNQIPFLQKKQNNKFDTKDVKKIQFKNSLYQSFLQFIRFYLKFIENQDHQIVCLLKEHDGIKLYDDNLIINIYDFIDKTNAGRMKNTLRQKFIQIFLATKQILKKRQRGVIINQLFQ